MKNYISSTHIKAALLSYWRFKRQFNCADEVSVCYTSMDVMVDTGGFLFEVEVKTSKSDLVQGEKRKDKHLKYIQGCGNSVDCKYIPNQYYLCVPTELVQVAKDWCEKTNPKYGILEYRPDKYWGYKWEDNIRITKRAKFLHENPITPHQKHELMQRMSSARAVYFQHMCRDYIDNGPEDWCI